MNFVIELPKLILYFDINKTLIFGDRAKNQPFESSVLSLVCENAWGTVNPKTMDVSIKGTFVRVSQRRPSELLPIPQDGLPKEERYRRTRHAKAGEDEQGE